MFYQITLMKKLCPCCGATFECYHDDIVHCQCATVHLTTEQLNYIRTHYDSCLCINCLKNIARLSENDLKETDETSCDACKDQ